MTILEILILIILILIVALLFFLIFRKKGDNEMYLKINKQFLEFEKSINENINSNKKELEYTKDIISKNTLKTVEMITTLAGTIGKLTEEQKHATKLTEDLKYLFRKPKSKGAYTEIILEEMLHRVLPKGIWYKQYMISENSTERVDFAIHYNKSIIPIDVKFPTDDYNRYVEESDIDKKQLLWKEFLRKLKLLIKDISKKYILPEYGTSEFAIMFIPTDSVYFDAITSENNEGFKNDLFDYSQAHKVLLTGPSTFYAFLQIIITGLRNIEIFKNTKKLIENIKKLERNIEHFSNKYDDVGNKLEKATQAYNVSLTHYDRIKKNAEQIISIDDNKEITKE